MAKNVRRSQEAGEIIWLKGHTPCMPLLSHYHQLQFHHSYNDWLCWSITWMKCCDMVVRLPGKSRGATIETKIAKKMGIPIIYSSLAKLKDEQFILPKKQ